MKTIIAVGLAALAWSGFGLSQTQAAYDPMETITTSDGRVLRLVQVQTPHGQSRFIFRPEESVTATTVAVCPEDGGLAPGVEVSASEQPVRLVRKQRPHGGEYYFYAPDEGGAPRRP